MILYLNCCDCGRKHCGENAAYMVKKQLKRVSLKDAAVEFLIEYVLAFLDSLLSKYVLNIGTYVDWFLVYTLFCQILDL